MPGRAGRVSKGYCYRLITKSFWNKEIPDHMTPDMLVRVFSLLFIQPKPSHRHFTPSPSPLAKWNGLYFVSSFSSELAPLATIVLKVKLLDIGDPRTILSTALSPPNLSDIMRTVLQLKEVLLEESAAVIWLACTQQSAAYKQCVHVM